MNLWQSITDPEYKAFLQSRGWSESEWNKTQPWERTAERVEFNGGLEKTGILRELPGAVSETVKEQAMAVGGAVKAVGGFATRTLLIVSFIAAVMAVIVYKPTLKKWLKEARA